MNEKPKKILVTGVAGFLGSHLAENLSKLGHKIVGVDNMTGGYRDNIPKNIKFYNFDCCDLNKMTGLKFLTPCLSATLCLYQLKTSAYNIFSF